MTDSSDKRLIEYYIPIYSISKEASHEKSVRRGHISTMHLWWARRPLVASRAAVFAALVSAPEDGATEHELNELMVRLTKWDLDREALTIAREMLEQQYLQSPPKVLDMFAGGGAIPLEMLRLGCDTYALDLNPVAHIIELATLVYPQKYGPQLLKDIRQWSDWILEQVQEEIGDLYPLIPDPLYQEHPEDRFEQTAMDLNLPQPPQQLPMDLPEGWDDGDLPDSSLAGEVPEGFLLPVAYVWSRTVVCPNPECRARVPLVRQTWLKKKSGDNYALEVVPHPGEKRMAFHVRHSTAPSTRKAAKEFGFDPSSFSSRGNSVCGYCGTTVTAEYAKAEGKAGRVSSQMISTVCIRPGKTGKVYLSPDDMRLPLPDDEEIRRRISHLEAETGITVPQEELAIEDNQHFQAPLYGMTRFGDLFTPRQLLSLLTFTKYVRRAYAQLQEVGCEEDYARAVTTYLGITLSRFTNFNSSLCVLYPAGGRGVRQVFIRQALPMIWDYAETNPFNPAAASWPASTNSVLEALESIDTETHAAQVSRGTATALPFSDGSLDAVITDPPYYDNVSYSDLSDFFYVWLSRAIGFLYPSHFSSELAPKKSEAISVSHRHKDDEEARDFYEAMMARAFSEAARVVKPSGIIVTIYAHKTTAGWATLVDALRNAGFKITEAWPVETEQSHRALSQGTAALASSFFLVGRKRNNGDIGDYIREVKPDMQRIVDERVRFFLAQGISGADLNIAAVGAGLAPYTRYARVELPNGEELTAADYLEEVQAEVVRVLLGKAAGADNPTQYYIMARQYYGHAWVDFDEANNLARAIGVELDTGAHALTGGDDALVEKKGSKVRLRSYDERGNEDKLGLPKGVQGRAPLIDVLHRLLWLIENDNSQIESFMNEATPDKYQLRVVAENLKGKALAGEPTPGAMRDERTPEQRAIDVLLASWNRIVHEGRMV